MTKFATVIVPHWLSAKWLQVCISSLKATKNDTEFDIIVFDNSAGNPSVKAIDNGLGEDIKVMVGNTPLQQTPAGCLDLAIDIIKTPWLFSAENDLRFMKDGWLDWYREQMPDEYIAMIGWYWSVNSPTFDDGRKYISPCGTLYNNEVLKIIKAGILANKQEVYCYGSNGMKKRKNVSDTGGDIINKAIKDGDWGPFRERRGFWDDYPIKNSPWMDHYGHDTGSWLYRRAKHQWECVELPGRWVAQKPINCPDVKYNYIGHTEADPYLIHYCAGGASHSYEVSNISGWMADSQEWWLRREDNLWKEIVPEKYRQDAIDRGLIMDLEEQVAFAKSKII